MSFHPYLFLAGTCREAFTRYQEIFGGDLTIITMGDMPESERMPGAPTETVMHAALVGGATTLMGSDDPTTDTPGPVQGIQVGYIAPDSATIKRVYEGLAAGGTEVQPLIPTSFSALFGMCIDRFGIPWLMTVDENAEPAGSPAA